MGVSFLPCVLMISSLYCQKVCRNSAVRYPCRGGGVTQLCEHHALDHALNALRYGQGALTRLALEAALGSYGQAWVHTSPRLVPASPARVQ